MSACCECDEEATTICLECGDPLCEDCEPYCSDCWTDLYGDDDDDEEDWEL